MAQLAAQAKMGYYPCPISTLDSLMSKLILCNDGPVTLLDPCAGEGLALKHLSDTLSIPDVYAVELDSGRYAQLRENLPESTSLEASFFSVAMPPRSLSLAWVNPPFDTDIGGGRIEMQFFAHAVRYVRPGGVLAMLMGKSVPEKPAFNQFARTWLDSVNLFDSDEGFGEVLAVAYCRAEPANHWSRAHDEVFDGTQEWVVPAGIPFTPNRFRRFRMEDSEIASLLEGSSLTNMIREREEFRPKSPPLAIPVGHISLLLSAGHLNGLVQPIGEDPHVVRGTVRKVEYVEQDEERYNQVSETVSHRTVLNERIELAVRAIWPDGIIRDFAAGAEGEPSIVEQMPTHLQPYKEMQLANVDKKRKMKVK